ncbi:MAG: hypothetical protein J6T74_08060 [Clostridia bacterium]|nr:hypothetical protein [Clostridia bacterium]
MAGANTPKPIEIIGGDGNIYVVDTWNHGTVADGVVMTDYTIRPICSAIQGGSNGLSAEIERAKKAEQEISAVVDAHYDEYSTFKTSVIASAESFSARLAQEISDREDGDEDLQEQIDTLKAATDVIMVYNTYSDFSTNSGSLTLTDNDVIKVLNDEERQENQTYYQYSTGTSTWTFIGELDPYYSKSELNNAAGKNINITTANGIKINTNDNVVFTTVSSNGFSGKNLSGASKNDSIDNLFGSAYSGAEASAWIYANSAILDIQPGYGLTYDINEQGNKVIGIRQDHCDYYGNSLALGSNSTANGDNSYAFGMSCVTNGSNALAIGDNARATTGAIALGTYNSAMGKYSLALGYNSTAFNQFSVAIGRGLSGEAPITLGTWNDNVAGATFIIGDGTGTQEGHDVVRKNALVIKDGLVSGRDFSAGNVSLSSLTNISAFGNGITNTATFNLSAVKLSAGQGIGFKNDTNGVLSITAEGTTYQAGDYISTANKTIAVTGNLITSANAGSAASAWINSNKSTIAFTTSFNGTSNVITGYGTSSFAGGISSISVRGSVFTGRNVNLYDSNNIDFTTANNSLTIDLHNNITLGETESKQVLILTENNDEVVIGADGPVIAINNTSQSQLQLFNNKITRDGKNTTWDKVISASNGNFVSAANNQTLTLASATTAITPSTMSNNIIYLV